MIVWCDGARDPVAHMRRDAELLARAERDARFEPVLRLFRFEPHGITLGYAQSAARELDLARCEADGVPWAVRPTGGRAIFHAQEWTYSLVARIDDPCWGGSLRTAYDAISALIVASLVRLGVPACHAPGRTSDSAAPPAVRGPAAPCFASTARHEVVVDGRKLVGSAQRRGAVALLQQGSVLLGDGHLRLADYLGLDPAARSRERERLAAAAVDAGRWLGGDAPLERWAEALRAELPPDTRSLEGAEAVAALTGSEGDSYTRAGIGAGQDSAGGTRCVR